MDAETCLPYTFAELLEPLRSLEGTRDAKKLAMIAAQAKIEHDLLAEIVYSGNHRYPKLEFRLEHERRDLIVRERESRRMIEWVEAKMCYTDCLARWKTGRPRPEEYAKLLLADAEKQEHSQADRGVVLTSLLFAIHFVDLPSGWKYGRDRRHCDSSHLGHIEEYAREYVLETIARRIGRNQVEVLVISLDGNCRLHVFGLRKQKSGRS